MSDSGFKFTEVTLDNAQEKLISRIVDAINNDTDVADSVVRHGWKAVEDMDGLELLQEYESWHGYFDEGDGDDDSIYQRMIKEKSDFEFEKEVLV